MLAAKTGVGVLRIDLRPQSLRASLSEDAIELKIFSGKPIGRAGNRAVRRSSGRFDGVSVRV